MFTNQHLIDSMQDLVFVLRVSDDGAQFYYHLINRVAREVLLLTDHIVNQTLHEVNPPDVADRLLEEYQKVVKKRSVYRYQDLYIDPLGNIREAETTLTPIIDSDKVTYVVAVTHDITEQKRIEKQKEISNQRLKFSRERYKSLFDENTDPIAYLNNTGKIIRMNQACRQFIDQIYQEEQEKNIFALLKTKDEELVVQTFAKTVQGEAQRVEMTILSQEKYEVRLQINFIPMFLEDNVKGVYLIFKDLTAEYFAKDALLKSEERFRLIAENSSDLIQIVDEKGYFSYLSPSHEHVLGFKIREFLGKKLTDFIDLKYQKKLEGQLNLAITEKETKRIETKFYNSRGDSQWFELKIEPVFDKQGEYHHTNIVARDIEERKRYEKELQRLAYHDPLTGLANRRLFNDRLSKVKAKFERDHLPFAVIMLDIDNFKEINDQFGHDAGDKVIVEMANRLQNVVREVDTVGRLGGDEFLVLLTDIESKVNLSSFIGRLERRLKAPYIVRDKDLYVGISLGAVISDQGMIRNDKSIVTEADKALYQAKRTGKNRAIIL